MCVLSVFLHTVTGIYGLGNETVQGDMSVS